MAVMRDVVLDPDSGMPAVVASRTQEGHLSFRVLKVHSGGMVVAEPVNDAVIAQISEHFDVNGDDEPLTMAERMKLVQAAYTGSLGDAERERLGQVDTLEQQLAAAGEIVEAERAARVAAEQELAKLRAQATKPASRAKQTQPAAT